MDLDTASPARRRRGQELEDALLDAAWDQLVEHGYVAFTIEAVAERAGTSRPVLYRRWPKRGDLVLAAVAHESRRNQVPVPDTGSLRADVIALLTGWNERRAGFAVLLSVLLGGYFTETGTTFADVRKVMIDGRTSVMETIVGRAVERGEVDPAVPTPRLVALPFDLFRNELVLRMGPVPESVVGEIVDDIFLPLITSAPRSKRN